jgi:hypothetical protein
MVVLVHHLYNLPPQVLRFECSFKQVAVRRGGKSPRGGNTADHGEQRTSCNSASNSIHGMPASRMLVTSAPRAYNDGGVRGASLSRHRVYPDVLPPGGSRRVAVAHVRADALRTGPPTRLDCRVHCMYPGGGRRVRRHVRAAAVTASVLTGAAPWRTELCDGEQYDGGVRGASLSLHRVYPVSLCSRRAGAARRRRKGEIALHVTQSPAQHTAICPPRRGGVSDTRARAHEWARCVEREWA